MRKIVIEIETDGSVNIDAKGFTGSSCSLATKELERALAGTGEVEDKKKPDFYATPSTRTQQKN